MYLSKTRPRPVSSAWLMVAALTVASGCTSAQPWTCTSDGRDATEVLEQQLKSNFGELITATQIVSDCGSGGERAVFFRPLDLESFRRGIVGSELCQGLPIPEGLTPDALSYFECNFPGLRGTIMLDRNVSNSSEAIAKRSTG